MRDGAAWAIVALVRARNDCRSRHPMILGLHDGRPRKRGSPEAFRRDAKRYESEIFIAARAVGLELGGPLRLRMASAMMERAEFPVHKKRTLYFFSMENPLPNAGKRVALTAPQGCNNQVRSMTFLYGLSPGGCLRERRTLPTHARRIADHVLSCSVAAFRFHFVAGEQSAVLPLLADGQHSGGRLHLNSQVRQTAACFRGSFIQVK